MSILPVWTGWSDDPEDVDVALPDEIEAACNGDLANTKPSYRAAVILTGSVRTPAPVSGDADEAHTQDGDKR